MTKLLRADLSRLAKDRPFLLSAALMALMGAALPVIHFLDTRNGGAAWTVDATSFAYAFFVPILAAVLTALFLGSGYSDGSLRNKCIVGHRRSGIYLSGMIICLLAGLLLCAAYLVPHTALGSLLLDAPETAPQVLLLYTGLTLAMTAAFTALFTLIAMLWQNKAYATAACILLAFALLLAGVRITAALNEPEYFQAYSYTENGVTVSQEAERNPNYLSGTKRQVYAFLLDFTPGGQALQLANMAADHPARLALYDAILLLTATGCGVAVFRHKDLR